VTRPMSTPNASPSRWRQFWLSQWRRLRTIRARIVLPYVILTVVLAFAGTYIVTTLVQGSLEERLRNQLADAAGVASDEVALFESELLAQLRELTFLQGAYEAMRAGDHQALQDLIIPTISNSGIRRTIVTDAAGRVVTDIVLEPDSADPNPGGALTTRDLSRVPLVSRALSGVADEYGDRHAGLLEIDNEIYLAIGGPFRLSSNVDHPGGELVGAIFVAQPLYSLLDQIKETAVVRRVTVYSAEGEAVATTLGQQEPRREELSISPGFFQAVLANPSRTLQDERQVLGRRVRFAYFVFLIRHEALGVMSIGIESGFVPATGAWGRLQLSAIFGAAMLGVLGIGYAVSQRIIKPVMQLVRTSRAVAQGDLSQRTGLRSEDELGVLAETFDDMTEKLAQRTTELERLLQEQREESSRVQAILSSIAEGVVMEDRSRQIELMNPAAQNLFAILSDQFRARKPIREIEPSTGGVRRFEIGDHIISVESSPVLMPDGKQLGKVLVVRDITRETEVDRLKDEFIAQISHELRTPLTSIKGYSDLLLRAMGGSVDEYQRPFLETISRHADTLEDMIADLLDFTQLEAGNLGLRFEPMSMERVVQEVVAKWAESYRDKNIALSTQVEGPIPQMLGDEGRLRRALANLVENAYHYTREGGQVSVTLGADDHAVTISVRDSGIGISEEDQAHLFTRFFRVGLERTVDVRGVGVDLYVTKAIVEGHGGEIRVESELGKGSTFTFSIPLDPGASVQEPSDESFADLGDLLG
jgi:signal transduction histidine kinase/HAMP domain-containing protein